MLRSAFVVCVALQGRSASGRHGRVREENGFASRHELRSVDTTHHDGAEGDSWCCPGEHVSPPHAVHWTGTMEATMAAARRANARP